MSEPIPYASREIKSRAGREAFGVVVRTIGLLLLLYGLYIGFFFVLSEFTPFPIYRLANYPRGWILVFGVIYTVVGILLFKGEWVVRLSYGEE